MTDVAHSGSDLTTSALAFVSGDLRITYTSGGETASDNQLVIGGSTSIQVRPTNQAPTSGNNIYRPTGLPGTASIATIVASADGSGGTDFGPLSSVVGTESAYTATTQNGGTETAGTAFSITVTAVDQFGEHRHLRDRGADGQLDA